ncbi:nickel/cobalt transporter [Siculibacillus lacustris]|uniref:Nickel/cobalt efflux system n=1 Tax=Siculibacillus lacustris TaxID=1549641 RepID=A0A4V2KUC9_9HYPH|nr:nickel/cobalt transporter [Siculibacillus lacustris]TBW40768.1 nickel/cobalt transporter [Siculibacillus lacustris]
MPVSTPTRFGRGLRIAVPVLVTALIAGAMLSAACEPAAAQAGPFGVAAPEAGGGVAAGGIFGWVAAQQSTFYRGLTAGLRAMRADPHAGWWLVALSFAYGVFHAAGPGHGKAVITSYVLADGETLRRGIALAFVSAFVQGAVAILFVGVAVGVLHTTALQMTDATLALERTSAAAILALGLWLTWQKIVRPLVARPVAVAAEPDVAVAEMRIGVPPAARRDGLARELRIGAPVAATAAVSGSSRRIVADPCDCGVLHAPDPAMLGGPFDWRRALAAVAAVGIRPCTGALIVLVFAFAQGLIGAGILAVLAMALGTGATVAALASLAVLARGVALRWAGDEGPWERRVLRAAEIGGALVVLAMGVLLAGAALWGGSGGG